MPVTEPIPEVMLPIAEAPKALLEIIPSPRELSVVPP